MEKRILTCIVCPKGCTVEVSFDENGKISDVTGYTCKRGFAYAENECTHPKRTVTSTVKCEDGGVVSVKTADAVPKEKVFEVMDAIRRAVAPDHVKIGDVIIQNAADTGVSVIVTSNR